MTPQTVDVPACTLCSRRARESTRCYQRQDEEDPGEEASTFQHKMNEDEVCLRGAGGMPQDILEPTMGIWARKQGEYMTIHILRISVEGSTYRKSWFYNAIWGFQKNIFPGQIQGVRLRLLLDFRGLQRFRHMTHFWRRHYDNFPLVVMVGPGRWSVTEDWSGSLGWIGSDLLGCKKCVMNVGTLGCP